MPAMLGDICVPSVKVQRRFGSHNGHSLELVRGMQQYETTTWPFEQAGHNRHCLRSYLILIISTVANELAEIHRKSLHLVLLLLLLIESVMIPCERLGMFDRNLILNSWISSYTRVYAIPNALNNTSAQNFSSSLGSLGTHSHALHQPHQCLSTHFRRVFGKCVGLGFEDEVGDGSTHMRPNHSFEVHVVLELVGEGAVEVEVGFVVVVGSRHPNQPSEVHVLELVPTLVDELIARVVVTVGQGAALEEVAEVCDVVVVVSLHPNLFFITSVHVLPCNTAYKQALLTSQVSRR